MQAQARGGWVGNWLAATGMLAATLVGVMALALATTARADDDQPVKVRAVAQHGSVAQGGRLVIAVELDHAEHFHTWPAKEVRLPSEVDEFAIRTEVAPAADKDGKPALPVWIARLDGVQFPQAKPGKVPDVTGKNPTVEVPLYSEKAVVYLRLDVKPDAPLGEQTMSVVAAFQACNETMCFQPQEIVVSVAVRVVKLGATELGAPVEPALFAKFDAAKWGSATAAAPAVPNPAPPKATLPGVGATFFGLNLGASALLLGIFGAIGGFILNLTPCVLPVIPIKVMTLSQHAGSKGRALVLGMWMALGVLAFWVAAGVPMAFISAGLDPSRYIFGVWWVTLSIALVIAIMGLGIMGLFTINLPQSVYSVETKADSPGGSFLFGVFTAILGLPCFGFVVGGLLAGASAMPWNAIMAVFVGLGIGMGAPYLVLAVWPELLKFIPRTGPASDVVKQVMGVLLLGASAYFVSAGIKAVLSDYPFVAGSIAWWAVAFFVAIAGLWMVVRTFQIAKTVPPKLVFPVLAIVMVLGIGVFAQGKFRDDRDNYHALVKAMGTAGPSNAAAPTGVWLNYTPELFAQVRASGRAVFLDFTADWCINCKAFKRLLLDQDPVLARLRSSDIVLMEVDCTSTRAKGWELLKELGRTGVPTWVVYGPRPDSAPVVVDVTTPTSQTVMDALDRAGVPKGSSGAASASR